MIILDPIELGKAYLKIQVTPLSLNEEMMAFYISQCRHDARLAEIVTESLRDCWWNFDPNRLNKKIKSQEHPEAILVIIEQLLTLTDPSKELETKINFTEWSKKVIANIESPKGTELYFINLVKKDSPMYHNIVKETIESFSKFNFYGNDILFNKQIPKKILSKYDYEHRYDRP